MRNFFMVGEENAIFNGMIMTIIWILHYQAIFGMAIPNIISGMG